MANVWYPFPFLEQAVNNGQTFAQLTGLAGLTQGGCPAPSFPIKKEYLDQTQILQYTIVGLERRFTQTAALPRKWTLTYDAITDSELAYLEAFFTARKGRWESFNFIDPEKWVFDPNFDINNTTYATVVRFDSSFSAERFTKNYYSLELTVVEVFEA